MECENISDSVCRTCLSTRDLRSLFPQTDEYYKFERALFLSTGCKISSSDGLSQSICKKCAKFVQSFMLFRIRSQRAEKKLLQFMTNTEKVSASPNYVTCNRDRKPMFQSVLMNNDEVDIKLECLINKDNDIGTEENEASFESDCNVKSESVTHDDLVVKNEFERDNDALFTKTSDNWDEPLSLSSDESKDVQSSKQKDRRYLDLIEGSPEERPLTCKICKKQFKNKGYFQLHAKCHLGYDHLCEFCAIRCPSRYGLRRHLVSKHGFEMYNNFACSFCDFKAIDKEQLEVHERKIHTNERPFVCDHCGAAFISRRVLIQHFRIHKTDKPFQCDKCPSKFKARSQLTYHTKFVHTKNFKVTFGCNICLKRFSRIVDARNHLLRVHGVPKDQQGKVPRFYFQPKQ